jgi:serine protease Do
MTRAKVINTAKQADVALLRLEEVPDGIQTVEMGDSDAIQAGDEVFVVGAPYGIDHTLTVGHISGRRQMAALCQLTPIELLQTDAGINMGSSGGPLFSMDGKVIGIVSRILSKSGGWEGLGFAISIKTARSLLFDRDTFWSGMETYLVSGELAKALNVPQEAGLLVQRIATGSIAQKAGIREGSLPVQIGNHMIIIGGDVLLEVQGIRISPDINDTCRIREDMDREEEKDIIRFKILRDGKILDLKARVTGKIEG